MKIVKVYGGLGNQMFQYAFARRLARESGDEVYLDASSFERERIHNGYELERLFGARFPVARPEDSRRLSVPPNGALNRIRRKYLTKRSHIIDRKFGYQPELFTLEGDLYFEGYWQSEKYFGGFATELRRELEFGLALSGRNAEVLASLPRPVASVHVRRGDYLKSPNLPVCTPDYYQRAVTAAASRGAASLLVFSDDIEYCRTGLDLGSLPRVFVDWNRGPDSWQDMAMMASCELHVIANSSFSWWGAWLDSRPGKAVFAPRPWNRRELVDRDRYYSYTFGDIVPERWERVPV